MKKKYELTEETKTLANGTVLRRIRAVSDLTLSGVKIVRAGDLGGWIEREDNLSHCGEAWVCDNALVYDKARVCDNALVYDKARVYDKAMVFGNAMVCGEALVKDYHDYAVYKNTWSSGRWFTYTRSDKMWAVGCFRGTGDELVEKAYKDSKLSGQCYEAIVRAQDAIDKANALCLPKEAAR